MAQMLATRVVESSAKAISGNSDVESGSNHIEVCIGEDSDLSGTALPLLNSDSFKFIYAHALVVSTVHP